MGSVIDGDVSNDLNEFGVGLFCEFVGECFSFVAVDFGQLNFDKFVCAEVLLNLCDDVACDSGFSELYNGSQVMSK